MQSSVHYSRVTVRSITCLGLVVAGAGGCGGSSSEGARSSRSPSGYVLTVPLQDDAEAFAHIQAVIETAEGVLVAIRIEPSHEARLRSVIDAARARLERLDAACKEHKTLGATSCLDEPSPAVATAGQALGQSLDDMAQIFAVKRGIRPPEDPEKDNRCKPQPVCPHKGRDDHHNECADREPPNIWPGCDALVNGKSFDALTAERVLWEVKTHAWSSYTPFLRNLTYQGFLIEARAEAKTARWCEFQFVYAVADQELYSALSLELDDITVRHVPRCKRGK